MDREQCITLLGRLEAVPDPRDARGKRYEWRVLLAILCAGLISGQKMVWGIADWAWHHGDEIIELLEIRKRRIPSASTFYWVLRQVGIARLEAEIAALGLAVQAAGCDGEGVQLADGEVVHGQAVDGKDVRGARAHGAGVYLVSLVCHESGIVLNECQVDDKTNEITVVPELLTGRDLHGVVVTMDALLTQRKIAQQILSQGGDYLMVVKGNQHQLCQAIDLLFQAPPLCKGEDERLKYSRSQKAHGRLETRTLETSALLNDYVGWPGAQQVLRRTYRAVDLHTGAVCQRITYGITSLSRQRAGPKQLEALWRGHWTIENCDHYVRDETFGEDRCQLHTGNAPQAMAALRNGVMNTLRYLGWHSIPAAFRHYAASVHDALQAVGALAT
jgi:predicted transposase YbfD/YdcC